MLKVSCLKTTNLENVHFEPLLTSCGFSSADQTPLEMLLLLCVPVVDPDKEDRNWRRPLNCLQLMIAPVVCVLAFQSGQCKNLAMHN